MHRERWATLHRPLKEAVNYGDPLRHELRMALLWSFTREGYSNEESAKLAEIAIGPVDQALMCAKAIYDLRVEEAGLRTPKVTLSNEALGRLLDDIEREP